MTLPIKKSKDQVLNICASELDAIGAQKKDPSYYEIPK